MVNVSLILRIVKFPLAILLIALSAAIFSLTGHAFYHVNVDYPASVNFASRYAWSESPTDYLTGKMHPVWLHYDWSNENFIWVVGGTCIVSGVLSLIDAVVQQWRAKKGYASKSNAFTFTILGFSSVALLVSFISAIYIPVNNANKRKATCRLEDGRKVNGELTCTRETVVCDIAYKLAIRSWDITERSCIELKAIRLMTIPMTILAALLVLVYIMQVRSVNKTDVRQPTAEERIARLQGDE